jgi:O-acetyl-ADP-ribose deacetylase (regulator of RNase III)
MLVYVRTSLFESPAQTLVNTVNTVGVMGKGVALEFKNRYPKMYENYRELCDNGVLTVGKLHLWRGNDQWILNFPTKTTWKKASEYSYIEDGLKTFVSSYKEMGISSIAFPPLGCGNGNLDWNLVRPLMEKYLANLEIPVYVHDRQVGKDFVPEHRDNRGATMPVSFESFLSDIKERLVSRSGSFRTLKGGSEFSALWSGDGGIEIDRPGRTEEIRPEHIEWAWTALQRGILSADQFPGDASRKTKSYLFPILADLPYVHVTEISKPGWPSNTPGHGLYLRREDQTKGPMKVHTNDRAKEQYCLSL